MKTNFKVACLQTNSTDIPIENINMLEKAFLKLHEKNVDFVCLPECVAIFRFKEKN